MAARRSACKKVMKFCENIMKPIKGQSHHESLTQWAVCPKILKLVSFDSVQYTELNETQLFRIGHFEFWHMNFGVLCILQPY